MASDVNEFVRDQIVFVSLRYLLPLHRQTTPLSVSRFRFLRDDMFPCFLFLVYIDSALLFGLIDENEENVCAAESGNYREK